MTSLGTTIARGVPELAYSKWPNRRVSELIELKYGKALVAGNRIEGSIPVYGSNGRCGSHNASLFKGPGVICGRKGQGPLGVEWCDSDFWVIDTAYSLVPISSDLDLRFAYYLFKHIGLNHLKDGTSNPSLSRDTFGAQKIPLPPLAYQQSISSALSLLDTKIALNHKINRTLEQTAREIFKSWFIDFDPVHAKLRGKTPFGMNKAVSSLFPDSFEKSALGEIPKGWKVEPVQRMFAEMIGGDWGKDSPDENYSKEIRCIRGADIPSIQSANLPTPPVRFVKEAALEKRTLREGDLVVEISGGSPTQSTGRSVFVERGLLKTLPNGVELSASNFCRLIRPETFEKGLWLYFYIRRSYEADDFLQWENGTTGIKNFAFAEWSERTNIVSPSTELLKYFSKIVSPLLELRWKNGVETSLLTKTRDILLPSLLAGEIITKGVV